jgi:hypothetical protein
MFFKQAWFKHSLNVRVHNRCLMLEGTRTFTVHGNTVHCTLKFRRAGAKVPLASLNRYVHITKDLDGTTEFCILYVFIFLCSYLQVLGSRTLLTSSLAEWDGALEKEIHDIRELKSLFQIFCKHVYIYIHTCQVHWEESKRKLSKALRQYNTRKKEDTHTKLRVGQNVSSILLLYPTTH